MTNSFLKTWAAGSLTLFLTFSGNAANLIVNGSFEDASVNPGSSYINIGVGNTSLTGWTVIANDVHYVGTFWQASDGTRSIDLDGNFDSPGAMTQSFATNPGQTYKVSFDLAGNLADLPIVKPMRVSADGQSADFFFDTTGKTYEDMGWIAINWSFIADDSSATLEFRSLVPTLDAGFGAAIDNVSVSAVPVPATVWLFGSALGFLGWMRRKTA